MIDLPEQEVWKNIEPDTRVSVRGAASLNGSLREVVAILDLLEKDRFHGCVWYLEHDLHVTQPDPPTA
jgi:hypothetical protein